MTTSKENICMNQIMEDMDQKPHSWYIPRPSLTLTKNQHQDAIRRYHRDSEVIDIDKSNSAKFSSSSSSTISSQHSKERQISMQTSIDAGGECEVKRGSRSSQGSSDSEQSIHSASSLLLTVANLENFAKIQEQSSRNNHFHNNSAFTGSRVISIKPSNFLSSSKPATKDADQLSTASSTHFTMVNGFGRSQSSGKSSFICKRSQQVTVLIVTMSLLFLIGIFTAVILLEMRNREMPR